MNTAALPPGAIPMASQPNAPDWTPGMKKKAEQIRNDPALATHANLNTDWIVKIVQAIRRIIHFIVRSVLNLLGVRSKEQEATETGKDAAVGQDDLEAPMLNGTGQAAIPMSTMDESIIGEDAAKWAGGNPGGFKPTPHPNTGVEDAIYSRKPTDSSAAAAGARPALGKPLYLLGQDDIAAVEEAATLQAMDAVHKRLQNPLVAQQADELLNQGKEHEAAALLMGPSVEAYQKHVESVKSRLSDSLDALLKSEVPDTDVRHAGIQEVIAGLPVLTAHSVFSESVQARILSHLRNHLPTVQELVQHKVTAGALSGLLEGTFSTEKEQALAKELPHLQPVFRFHRSPDEDSAPGAIPDRPRMG